MRRTKAVTYFSKTLHLRCVTVSEYASDIGVIRTMSNIYNNNNNNNNNSNNNNNNTCVLKWSTPSLRSSLKIPPFQWPSYRIMFDLLVYFS